MKSAAPEPVRNESSALGDRMWPDVRDSSEATLLVPLGSLEQHGPHLPLATDSLIAQAWAQGIAARLTHSAVVAPLLPYGASGEHQDFAGTISIGTETLHLVLVELVRSASARFPIIIFVSGHAGNADALERATSQLRTEGHRVAFLLPHVAGADAHAGHTETSLLLHLAPSRVFLDRAEPGRTEPISQLIDELRAGGVASVSSNGVLGDPSGSNAAHGAEILESLVETGVRSVTRILTSF